MFENKGEQARPSIRVFDQMSIGLVMCVLKTLANLGVSINLLYSYQSCNVITINESLYQTNSIVAHCRAYILINTT